jgi:hypothetical protein
MQVHVAVTIRPLSHAFSGCSVAGQCSCLQAAGSGSYPYLDALLLYPPAHIVIHM